jgi:hypothetical protein
MLTLSTIRAGLVFIALAMISALISANIRQWASAEGHDRYIVNFAEWASTRQKWLWLCLLLSGALLVWSLLPEAPQDQNIAKEISSQQQTTPTAAPPVSDNKPARPPPAYGGLYPWQSTIFMNGLEGMRAELSSKIMIARPQMVEPQQFSRAFENAAMRAGFEPIVLQQNPAGRDQTGVLVAVPDIDAPSLSALKMQVLVKELGYEGRFIPLLDTSSRQAAPLHANDVGNFAIYIGPSPLQ